MCPPRAAADRGGNDNCDTPVWNGDRVMKPRARRLAGDALLSAGGVVLVLIVLLSVDVRVREQVERTLAATSSSTLVSAGGQAGAVATVILDAAKMQAAEHATMMMLVVAATVLVLAMVRS